MKKSYATLDFPVFLSHIVQFAPLEQQRSWKRRGYVADMSDRIFAILYLYLPKTFSICRETFRT